MNRSEFSEDSMTRVLWSAMAVLGLTTVHHVYGAYVYDTPWRLHVGYVSGLAAAMTLAAFFVERRSRSDLLRATAFWVFSAVTLLFPVLLVGLFEGGYNHALKVALYFGGATPALMDRLFPPPTYERPGDLFFEITGVMQLFMGIAAGWRLYELRRGRLTTSSDVHTGGAVRSHG